MGLNWAKPGANYVPAYQSSGLPYVTRSAATEVTTTPLQHAFPFATRFFTIANTGTNGMRVGFTENGVNAAETANYFVIHPFTSASFRYEIRCKELWFRSEANSTGFELVAGLTNIKEFPTLTGSLISVGFGAPTTSSWPGVG